MKMSNIKIIKDIQSYIIGNNEFSFIESSLSTTHYPINLDFTLQKEKYYYEPKDNNGIPIRIYNSVGQQYNPTRVAAYGLAHYNQYLNTNSEDNLYTFIKVADWFMQRSRDGKWVYEFPWGDLRPPWISAMAQGEGISVLVRAWFVTGDRKYLQRAVDAAEPFKVEIEDGGVRSALADGSPFLEEYPTTKPEHVLNGFLYAVIGLTDLYRTKKWVAPEEISPKLFIEVLNRRLSDWDLGCWSAYDTSFVKGYFRNYTTVSYHRLHITQLKYLGRFWQSKAIENVANKWDTAEKSVKCRIKAMMYKMIYRTIVKAER